MLKVIDYYSLTPYQLQSFHAFCEKAAESGEPAAENMRNMRRLVADRFTGRGVMLALLNHGVAVGCSGAYISDFSPRIGIMGVRTWLHPAYRNKQYVRDLLLPVQRDWMISKGMGQIALTFNDYNRNLVHLFKRQIVKRVARTPRHMFYLNMTALNYRVVIQHTPQWVIYEKLDPSWSFDWLTLSRSYD